MHEELSLALDDIMIFWFGEQDLHDLDYEYPLARWFGISLAVDIHLRQRFGWLHQLFLEESSASVLIEQCIRAANISGRPKGWAHVGLVVLLDQFSRNIHRGTRLMFGTDSLALPLAMEAITRYPSLSWPEQLILSVCLTHAEDVKIIERSIDIRKDIIAAIPTGHVHLRRVFERALQQGYKHRDIVERFGRYPHRNEILQRVSTPEELAFLDKNRDIDFMNSVASIATPAALQDRISKYLEQHDAAPHAYVPLPLLEQWCSEMGILPSNP